jgi:hypothetical protein
MRILKVSVPFLHLNVRSVFRLDKAHLLSPNCDPCSILGRHEGIPKEVYEL